MFAPIVPRRRLPTSPLQLPVLLLALVLLPGCGDGASERAGGASSAEVDAAELGRRVYRNQCATCHQPDGGGVPGIYPPLHGTEWVTGDEGRLIRLTLNGLRGPIEVAGQTYDNVMTPHDFLSDEQIAAVLTYVRSNFGNEAGPVTREQVAAVRAADEHDGFWTAEEVWERTGIPEIAAP